jgi:hypothetical protein
MIGQDAGAAAGNQDGAEQATCEESCGHHGRASRGSREDVHVHDTSRSKGWSRAGLLLALLLAGCSEGVKFVQETETGGVVVYPYKGDNSLVSTFRGDALDMMQKKCPKGYTVLKEGETRPLRRIHENAGGSEAIELKRWAIQFRCK